MQGKIHSAVQKCIKSLFEANMTPVKSKPYTVTVILVAKHPPLCHEPSTTSELENTQMFY